MAKLEQGILGPFTGKVGTVVGYQWRGLQVVRAYRRVVRYPNTPRQQEQRNWFVQMVRFASTARAALLIGLHHAAEREQMTEGNLFVKRNKRHFSLDGTVDYSRLQFASGVVGTAAFEYYSVDMHGTLEVHYGRGIGRAQDKLFVYAYCPALGQGILSQSTLRRDGVLRMSLPDEWAGYELAVYGFCTDAKGHASQSVYVPLQDTAEEAVAQKEKGTIPEDLSLVYEVVDSGVSVDPRLADVSWSSGRQSPL